MLGRSCRDVRVFAACICFIAASGPAVSIIHQDINTMSAVNGVGNFVGILVGSTVIGCMFGLFATFTFKYIHLANHHSNGVQETAVLLLFAYASYVFGTLFGCRFLVWFLAPVISVCAGNCLCPFLLTSLGPARTPPPPLRSFVSRVRHRALLERAAHAIPR